MRVVMFYHSILSDWDNGQAHFLRGVATELRLRGHEVVIYEPKEGRSLQALVAQHGTGPLSEFQRRYSGLTSLFYGLDRLDLDVALDGAELVLVHEHNDDALIRRLGQHRARAGGFRLLFHDTHHRSLTDRRRVAGYDLAHYDGILAFGKVLRELYLAKGWARQAWVWHEAADTRMFRPVDDVECEGDLIWVGNWGENERSAELLEYFVRPAAQLRLAARMYGVLFPREMLDALRRAHIRYSGWLPNYRVPEVYARHRVTVHVPRRPYVEALPGIPTIRLFEALACGIPVVSAPWRDDEHLFTPGKDFVLARDGRAMARHLYDLVHDEEMASEIALQGHRTVLARHTCAHRVDELLTICRELGLYAGYSRSERPSAPVMHRV